MEQFLYELAETKYRMYQELFRFKSYAQTEDDCFERIKYKSKYLMLLDVINMLPPNEATQLRKIEEQYFNSIKE